MAEGLGSFFLVLYCDILLSSHAVEFFPKIGRELVHSILLLGIENSAECHSTVIIKLGYKSDRIQDDC